MSLVISFYIVHDLSLLLFKLNQPFCVIHTYTDKCFTLCCIKKGNKSVNEKRLHSIHVFILWL